MKKMIFKTELILLVFLLIMSNAKAQRYMENLNRGIVAVRPSTSEVLINWRILGNEYADNATYNLYRGSTLIAEGLRVSNYVDATSTDYSYSVAAVINGTEQSLSAAVSPLANQYFTIPVRTINGGYSTYNINDASVGDLDGDGEYEIVVKRLSNDNTIAATTYHYLEAYKLDGTFLWAINLGPNLNNEVEVNFLVYDLDNDGKAEVATRTSDGMIDGLGNNIGDRDGDGQTNYRSTMVLNSSYYRIDGPDYISIFDGETGGEIAWDWYIDREPLSQWGTAGMTDAQLGHRAEKCMWAVAYLDGVNPSFIISRGIYHRIKMEAWNYSNGTLTQKWTWDSDPNGVATAYTGQGFHNLAAGDIDGDGRDEMVYGSMAVNEYGSGIYSTQYGHGDAGHLADINPNISGLEFFGCLEGANGSTVPGTALRNAAGGSIQWQYMTSGDVGRCMAADIDENYYGMEIWGSDGSGIYSCTGTKISSTLPTTAGGGSTYNFGVWWDGDVQRELLDRTVITKWNASSQSTDRVATLYNVASISANNSTKSNPCLMADILGDWREEVIYRSSDNSGMVVFVTPYSTSQRMYTLMHDPNYRLAIAWQNDSYNQPPNLGFYFGGGMGTPPTPNITLVGGSATLTKHGAGSSSQTVALGSAITSFYYTWDNATSATASGLPSGVSATVNTSAQTITISGTPTVAGTYPFTVTTVGGSTNVSMGGTITVTSSSSSTLTYEGENAVINTGVTESTNTGYSGTGYANTDNVQGTYVEWTVTTSVAGSFTIFFRYANGGSTDRLADIYVNGTKILSSVSFASTGSWTTWANTVTKAVTLVSGTNTIKVVSITDAGCANLDYLSVTGPGTLKSAMDDNVPDLSDNFDVKISPNPITRTSNLIINLDEESAVSVKIINMEGKLIREIPMENLTEGSHSIGVTNEGLSKGIYLCNVIINGKKQTIQMLVNE